MRKKNSNKPINNCWEFFNEPEESRKKCIVYQLGLGKHSCLFIDQHQKGNYAYSRYGTCYNCPWMKKNYKF